MPDQSFAYTLVPSSLADFLTKLKTTGVPTKIDKTYLAAAGLKSSNHRAFIPVMKAIGLLDGQGIPTDRYRRGLRGGDAGRSLIGEGIKEGYKSLFDMYPDAYRQPTEVISTFISAHSDLGDRALSAAVGTFRTLCKFATFDGDPSPLEESEESEVDSESDASRKRAPKDGVRQQMRQPHNGGSLTINVNIALSVDATSDATVYDAFFAAMAKHILVLGDDGAVTKSS